METRRGSLLRLLERTQTTLPPILWLPLLLLRFYWPSRLRSMVRGERGDKERRQGSHLRASDNDISVLSPQSESTSFKNVLSICRVKHLSIEIEGHTPLSGLTCTTLHSSAGAAEYP